MCWHVERRLRRPFMASEASNPHLRRVRSGCCALSASKLAATLYAYYDRLLILYIQCCQFFIDEIQPFAAFTRQR
ncbi:hypothetical protein SAMN05192562_104468 [Kosakonia arachidis]|uniref:Uncharacterized protein n=1 Tax=Kosakonia arachidis TaxID=551989 RepID=A0A1I7D6M6_9ENTR|nr:hypothetical protein SAMN05192562_104468 [Kosakonia arachidis]